MPDTHVIRATVPTSQSTATAASAAAHEPLTFVLFGATGDLSGRKILPALFALWQGKFLPEKISVIGVAIEKLSDDQFRDLALKSVKEHGRLKPSDDDEWNRFAALLSYQSVDFASADSFAMLGTRVTQLEKQLGLSGNRLFYLAIAPSFFAPVLKQLS